MGRPKLTLIRLAIYGFHVSFGDGGVIFQVAMEIEKTETRKSKQVAEMEVDDSEAEKLDSPTNSQQTSNIFRLFHLIYFLIYLFVFH